MAEVARAAAPGGLSRPSSPSSVGVHTRATEAVPTTNGLNTVLCPAAETHTDMAVWGVHSPGSRGTSHRNRRGKSDLLKNFLGASGARVYNN